MASKTRLNLHYPKIEAVATIHLSKVDSGFMQIQIKF
jgi:hypothetical protein